MQEHEKYEPADISVEDALRLFDEHRDYWSEIYEEARTDLNMALGIGHWTDTEVKARRDIGKPTLTINQLPQFIHQVTNDIRQNTPSVKVIPDKDGDKDTAEVFAGLMRAIEYKSKADIAYDLAAEYAVKCSIGFITFDHVYKDDDTDEQEVIIEAVADPLSIYLDPSSVEYDGRDANSAFRLKPMSRKDFEKEYPDKQCSSFTEPENGNVNDIVLGELFIREWAGKRKKKAIIHHYLFSGKDRLKASKFPGKYIPIVPFYGEMTWVDGTRYIQSLIRQARDPQKRLNHWASKEAEILSMAPIAPVMAEQGSLVNNRKQWQSPGSEMVLEYKSTIDGRAVSPPQRLQPPPIPTGIINAMQGAKENIKESMGMYNASIGQRSNETSGVAIAQRQREGDVATFHFADNTRRSINQGGDVMLCMIPEVYDYEDIVQTIDLDNNYKLVGINGAMTEDQKNPFDLTRGKYHVRVTTGASYTTKRQEASAMFGDLINKKPELLQVIGDIWARNLDIPGGESLANRLEKLIPPNLKESQDGEEELDPKVMQLAQALEQAKAQLQQVMQAAGEMKQQLDSKQTETQAKVQDTQTKAEVEVMKLQQATEQSRLDFEMKQMELQAKQEEVQGNNAIKIAELQLKAQELQLKAQDMMQPKESMQEGIEQEDDGQEMKMMQTQAVLEAIGSIKQSLDGLTSAVNQPKQVAYDDNGNIVGVQ